MQPATEYPDPDQLLRVHEVAAILRLNPETVYRLANDGTLPRGMKLGNLRRWTRQEVRDYIAERQALLAGS